MSELKLNPANLLPAQRRNSNPKLRIAFYVYPTAFQNPGGGEVQLLKTKEYLEKRGQQVTLFDPWRDKLKNFDILHTFGSVKEALPMMEAAVHAGITNVLSTVCWYSLRSAFGTYGSATNKTIAIIRHLAKVFLPKIGSERKRMMEISKLLLPNSQSEASQLERFFCAPKDKIHVIPNGVDDYFSRATPDAFIKHFGIRNFVLCVGRIEPRKNQLNMVKALNNCGVPVVFIGEAVSHYKQYEAECKSVAASNIHFLGPISRDSELLASAFAACNTFVLASWLETPGLAALEAGLAGAKVVITNQGATREYFKHFAHYVNPSDPHQIREVTMKAYLENKTNLLKDHIQSHYLWEHVADKTLEAYQSLNLVQHG